MLGLSTPSRSSTLSAYVFNLGEATKRDPNSLEKAVPTQQGNLWRLTLQNQTTVGTTPDQALTYTVPLKNLLGTEVTLGWEDMIDLLLIAGEAAPTDVRIMIGLSEGGGPLSTRRGIASALVYAAGDWLMQHTTNAAGSSWAAWTSAAADSSSTRMVKLNCQIGSTAAQGQHGSAILDVNGTPITLTNGSNNTARAIATPAFTHVFVGADWSTGSGGSDGETIDIKGTAACLNLTDVPNVI